MWRGIEYDVFRVSFYLAPEIWLEVCGYRSDDLLLDEVFRAIIVPFVTKLERGICFDVPGVGFNLICGTMALVNADMDAQYKLL